MKPRKVGRLFRERKTTVKMRDYFNKKDKRKNVSLLQKRKNRGVRIAHRRCVNRD